MSNKLLQNLLFYLAWIGLTFILLVSLCQLISYWQGLAARTFDGRYAFYGRLATAGFYLLFALLLLALTLYGQAFVHTTSAVWLEFILLGLYALVLFYLTCWPFFTEILLPERHAFLSWMLRFGADETLACGCILGGWSLGSLFLRLHRSAA